MTKQFRGAQILFYIECYPIILDRIELYSIKNYEREEYYHKMFMRYKAVKIKFSKRCVRELSRPINESESDQNGCSYPNCGCASARLCMFKNPNEAALNLNIEKGQIYD